MGKRKINTNSPVDWCKKHPDCFEWTCRECHQASLDYTETRLMDLHEEIKGLLAHAGRDMSHGAVSQWGWTNGDFVVEMSEEGE